MDKIRQLVTLKPKSKIHPNIVKVKGKDIRNPTETANAYNNCFYIDVGPNLPNAIPGPSKPFRNFLKIIQ